ncbi:MAG: RNA-binding protein [Endomicrobiales bacterium]|nr:RNA-binding protein [Endomicrobiales bacterium]
MNIYVGNLSWELTEDELRAAFEAYGQVSSASVIKDKFSGQPRGFGFVEMPNEEEAKAAIQSLNGKELRNRALTVNEARPRREKKHSHGSRDRFGGSGGRGRDRNRSGRSRGFDRY